MCQKFLKATSTKICYLYLPNPPPSERSTPPQESCKSFHWCEPCQASHSTPSFRFPFKDLSKMDLLRLAKKNFADDDSFQFCQDNICAVFSKDLFLTSKLTSFWTLVTFFSSHIFSPRVWLNFSQKISIWPLLKISFEFMSHLFHISALILFTTSLIENNLLSMKDTKYER